MHDDSRPAERSIRRKRGLGTPKLALAILALTLSQPVRAGETAKPDILLVMPDQMRGDCLSIAGHPAVRTPHLDALAQQGALFRRAYSTCPSCIPARHSLLTGLFPATSGVVGYAARPIHSPTLPQLLAQAGYQTVLCGRYMHQEPASDHYGYQQEIRGSTYVGDDDYDTFLKQAAPASGGILKLVAQLGVSMNGWVAKPWPLADDLHPTAWIARQARQVLADAAAEKPIFLTASFYAPHSPLFPPRRYYDFYAQATLPAPAHGDWVDWAALSPAGDRVGHRVRLEGAVLQAAQAGYFGLIEHLDDQLVPLLADFQARSRKAHRPWVIVFTSDHGELLGDNGYYRKCEPYEGSVHIPLIITGSPELGFQSGLRLDQPVCLEDLMPTLLELAGQPAPAPLDGVSLAPVLRGELRSLRHWLHLEHAPCYGPAQAFHALTDGHCKYIWRPVNGVEQLFDIDHDAKEEHDLARDPAQRALLERCRGEMVQRLAHRPEGFSDGVKLIPGRPYPPLQNRGS